MSKPIIFPLNSFLGNFYRDLAIFSGHTACLPLIIIILFRFFDVCPNLVSAAASLQTTTLTVLMTSSHLEKNCFDLVQRQQAVQ